MKYINSIFLLFGLMVFVSCGDVESQSDDESSSSSGLQVLAAPLATSVSVNGRMILTFSNELNEATITPSSVYLKSSSSAAVEGHFEVKFLLKLTIK